MLNSINRRSERDTKRIIKLSKTNRFVWLLLQLAWLHEGCHYIAARLTGAKVSKITVTQTDVEIETVSQALLIPLAPILPGLVIFIPSFILSVISPVTSPWFFVYSIVLCLSAIWLTACLRDFQQIWEALRSIKISWK